MHPRVLVKMDIEGSEFAVIPQLMMTGRLCRVVDYLSVEWHARFAPVRFHVNQQLNLRTREEAQNVVRLLKAAMADGGHAGGCLTNVSEIDDETYVHDGHPLADYTVRPTGGANNLLLLSRASYSAPSSYAHLDGHH